MRRGATGQEGGHTSLPEAPTVVLISTSASVLLSHRTSVFQITFKKSYKVPKFGCGGRQGIAFCCVKDGNKTRMLSSGDPGSVSTSVAAVTLTVSGLPCEAEVGIKETINCHNLQTKTFYNAMPLRDVVMHGTTSWGTSGAA